MLRRYNRGMRRYWLVLLLVLGCASFANAQAPGAEQSEGAYDTVHMPWPPPEKLVADLRSQDDATLRNARRLIGVEPRAPKAKVEMPDSLELRYIDLNEDGPLQAIVFAEFDLSYVYAAIAIHTPKGWERIAAFSCWCKYERGDLLKTFVAVEFGLKGSELVVRGSSGGTGLYIQYEEPFRLRHAELREVLSFETHEQDCNLLAPQNGDCKITRRWFYVGNNHVVLVEASYIVPLDVPSGPDAYAEEIDLRHATRFSCTPYAWDEPKFAYVKSSEAHACTGDEAGQ
jgi:hypothetical protein